MNRAILPIIFTLLVPFIWAQAAKPSRPSRTSVRYHEARTAITVPTGSSASVRALIRKIKSDQYNNTRLSSKVFDRLSYQEKFTYVMIHGEDSSQNCSVMPGIMEEERKIFAFTPAPFDDHEAAWSERQTSFLVKNRARVIGSMRESIKTKGRVGSNFKHAVLELKAVELVPDLVGVYHRTRADHDILTVLMLLMKEAKYRPFLATPIYKKLFGNEMNFERFVPATAANQRIVIDHAVRFHQSSRK